MSTITEDLETLLSLEPELAARAALSFHGPELDVQHTRGWATFVGNTVTEYRHKVIRLKKLMEDMDPELEKALLDILEIKTTKELLSPLRTLADASPSQMVH